MRQVNFVSADNAANTKSKIQICADKEACHLQDSDVVPMHASSSKDYVDVNETEHIDDSFDNFTLFDGDIDMNEAANDFSYEMLSGISPLPTVVDASITRILLNINVLLHSIECHTHLIL